MTDDNTQENAPGRRRAVGMFAAAIAGAAGFSWWLRSRSDALRWLPEIAGFQRVSSGEISGTIDPFIGLTGTVDPLDPPSDIVDAVRAAPCRHLFGAKPLGDIPVAVFTDYFCPVCRVFEADLVAFARSEPRIGPIRWLELPLLGEASVAAARLALAADQQGAYDNMRAALLRSRVVANDAYARSLSARLGLDPDRLVADAASVQVTRQLQEVRALRGLLDIPGTPSMAMGGTVVIGRMSSRQLDRLADQTPAAPC